MTPPKSYREYCLPFYEKHSAQARAAGKPYAAHLDGRTGALRDLIAASGFDVIESLSLPEIGGDQTLAEARAAFPARSSSPTCPPIGASAPTAKSKPRSAIYWPRRATSYPSCSRSARTSP